MRGFRISYVLEFVHAVQKLHKLLPPGLSEKNWKRLGWFGGESGPFWAKTWNSQNCFKNTIVIYAYCVFDAYFTVLNVPNDCMKHPYHSVKRGLRGDWNIHGDRWLVIFYSSIDRQTLKKDGTKKCIFLKAKWKQNSNKGSDQQEAWTANRCTCNFPLVGH